MLFEGETIQENQCRVVPNALLCFYPRDRLNPCDIKSIFLPISFLIKSVSHIYNNGSKAQALDPGMSEFIYKVLMLRKILNPSEPHFFHL